MYIVPTILIKYKNKYIFIKLLDIILLSIKNGVVHKENGKIT